LNYFHAHGIKDSVNHYTLLINQAKEKEKSFVNQGKIESNFIDFALANEKAKSDTIKKNNTYLRYGLIIISSLLLIIFWLFYRNIIQIKKIKEQYFTINNKNLDLNELLIKQNVLLSEVHHRVKNNLQLVISMITVLSKKLTGEDQIQLLRDVTNKIHSMALIHEQLYKKNDFDTIELGEYFNELAENFKSIQARILQLLSHCNQIKLKLISKQLYLLVSYLPN
jgi:two-component sensor histidine kinase